MWTFQTYFAEAAKRQWSAEEAAVRLLRRMATPTTQGKVYGIRKELHCRFPSIEENQAAGRYLDPTWSIGRQDFEPSPVPWCLWQVFEVVKPDLTSHWQDDEEEPIHWADVDWVAGTLTTTEHCDLGISNRIDELLVTFHHLSITPTLGLNALSYSDEEMKIKVEGWPTNNSEHFWLSIRKDPKRSKGVTQSDVRLLWSKHRNPERKRTGRPPGR